MPKLPRSVKSGRAQSGTSPKSSRGSKGNGKTAKKAKTDGHDPTLDPVNFEHRQVDEAAAANGGAMTATVELNEFEQGLLSDLFAVVEEHARDAVDQIDRGLIER